MKPEQFSSSALVRLLHKRKIATLPELMEALGTSVKRTVFRKLKPLSYRTSYSHRGCYYTLDDIARFDEVGLWSLRSVWFSMHGTLLATAETWADTSEAGYFVGELDHALQVSTKDALRKLVADGRLARENVDGQYLYGSTDRKRRKQQLLARRVRQAEPRLGGPLPKARVMPDELKAAIVLFFSALNERERRLYAGVESLKMGHGGDREIAGLLGVDVATVARGRSQLLRRDIDVERIRKVGGGRKAVEKKRQKSSRKSKV